MVKSAKSRGSTKARKALDQPFDNAVLAKAKTIADQYQMVLELEGGIWFGHGLEMPGVHGDGKTVEAAVADTRQALVGAVAYLLEEGQRPPKPASQGGRSVQVNIRLTPDEKAVLEARARAKGFRGLSDFIRAALLAESTA